MALVNGTKDVIWHCHGNNNMKKQETLCYTEVQGTPRANGQETAVTRDCAGV